MKKRRIRHTTLYVKQDARLRPRVKHQLFASHAQCAGVSTPVVPLQAAFKLLKHFKNTVFFLHFFFAHSVILRVLVLHNTSCLDVLSDVLAPSSDRCLCEYAACLNSVPLAWNILNISCIFCGLDESGLCLPWRHPQLCVSIHGVDLHRTCQHPTTSFFCRSYDTPSSLQVSW